VPAPATREIRSGAGNGAGNGAHNNARNALRSPRWRKAFGDVRQHPGRTLLVVLAIAVSLAAAGTILNAWALVRVTTREEFLASAPPAAVVHVDSVTPALLEAARRVPGVTAAEARRTVSARALVNGVGVSAVLFVSPRLADDRIGRVKPGTAPWPPRDGTISVEHSSVDFAGASVGDDVQLTIGDRPPFATTVGGIVRDVTLAPGWMEHLLYAYVTPATLDRAGIPSHPNELRLGIIASDRAAIRNVAEQVGALAAAQGRRVGDIDVPEPGEHVHAAQMDALLYTQGAFALLALALSACLVVNLMAALLAGQAREIGVMKAIGAQPSQITRLYLTVAALLGVGALLVALPAAWYAGRWYATLKGDLLNFDTTAYSIPWWAIVAQVVAGIFVPVLAAWVPVARSGRRSVGDALRDVGIADDQAVRVLHTVKGVPRPMLLALRNAFRRRQRLLLTLGTLATGGAVFLGALNLRASVLRATDAIFAPQRYDLSLRMAAPHRLDSLEQLVRAVPGVAAAEAWTGVRVTPESARDGAGNSFSVVALPPESRLYAANLVSGRWLITRDTLSLVINGALVREHPTWLVDSVITLRSGGVLRPWRIVGVVETGPGAGAYMARDVAPLVSAAPSVATVVVRQQRNASDDNAPSPLLLVQELRAALLAADMPVASSSLIAEARSAIDDHLLMVVDFLGAIAWLMMFVGGLALASTMGLAVLERTREIGVLRAIGANHRAIFRLIQTEGLTMAALSWLIAIPLSVPMSVLLAKAFSRIMLPVPITWLPNLTGVTLWLLLVLVVSVSACAWPARRAMRIPTAAALSYD
jgi:putative ABC transport system permease protein